MFGLGNFPSPDAPNAERGGTSPGVDKHVETLKLKRYFTILKSRAVCVKEGAFLEKVSRVGASSDSRGLQRIYNTVVLTRSCGSMITILLPAVPCWHAGTSRSGF